ncbi:hypothetical protein BKA67DRAFT_533764 [Truncatella angustata]|uniref:Uncharacterized protein n=1 Tax=Truncatella angustata TaxID=152316 RepID=A0A9P8UUJ4_9PEZI|nr:uncharacterized protein BKA67DRAFT_533764 [Truncatella angustata]KAH6658634.1 hypothetical protein BKA67DRAFT_533764 [Truncatella angustata]
MSSQWSYSILLIDNFATGVHIYRGGGRNDYEKWLTFFAKCLQGLSATAPDFCLFSSVIVHNPKRTMTVTGHNGFISIMLPLSRSGNLQRYRLAHKKHAEILTIQKEPFYRDNNSKPFYECRIFSISCCHETAITDGQIFEFVKQLYNGEVGEGYWIYNKQPRQVRSELHDIPCESWEGTQEHSHLNDTETLPSEHISMTDNNAPSTEAEGAEKDNGGGKRQRIHGAHRVKLTTKGCIQKAVSNPDEAKTVFVKRCAAMVEKGLVELGQTHDTVGKTPKSRNKSKRSFGSIAEANIGANLSQYQQQILTKRSRTDLADLLEAHGAILESDSWRANIFSRYIRLYFRGLDEKHPDRGNCDEEQYAQKKARFCEVMAALVNSLEPVWGVCALFVFDGFGDGKEIQITIPEDTLVTNPAWFISCVTNQSCSDTCTMIGLDKFAYLDVQSAIDDHATRIADLGLLCGRFPLSKLLALEKGERAGRAIKREGGLLHITLTYPGAQVTGGKSHVPGAIPENSADKRDDGMTGNTQDHGSEAVGDAPRRTCPSETNNGEHPSTGTRSWCSTGMGTIDLLVAATAHVSPPTTHHPGQQNLMEPTSARTSHMVFHEQEFQVSGSIESRSGITSAINDPWVPGDEESSQSFQQASQLGMLMDWDWVTARQDPILISLDGIGSGGVISGYDLNDLVLENHGDYETRHGTT